jgi:hypothetical protein
LRFLDDRFGSKREELSLSKCFPVDSCVRTFLDEVSVSQTGHLRTAESASERCRAFNECGCNCGFVERQSSTVRAGARPGSICLLRTGCRKHSGFEAQDVILTPFFTLIQAGKR